MTRCSFSGSELAPDGLYPIVFDHYRITSRFGRGSLELWFRIMEFGPFFEMPVCRYYKVTRSGKAGFSARPCSAFVREFLAVFGRKPPVGTQAVRWFSPDRLIQARVATVTKGHDQREIPELARYNVVRELIGGCQP